jgi:hypothetical protein
MLLLLLLTDDDDSCVVLLLLCVTVFADELDWLCCTLELLEMADELDNSCCVSELLELKSSPPLLPPEEHEKVNTIARNRLATNVIFWKNLNLLIKPP